MFQTAGTAANQLDLAPDSPACNLPAFAEIPLEHLMSALCQFLAASLDFVWYIVTGIDKAQLRIKGFDAIPLAIIPNYRGLSDLEIDAI